MPRSRIFGVPGRLPLITLLLLIWLLGGGFSGFSCRQKQGPPPVTPIDRQGLRQLISHREGKVLFLNVWATWCGPCREEFPDLNHLAARYAHSDVEVVALSVDYPDEIETKILPFLRSQQVIFPVYVQHFSDDTVLINQLNPEWNGALPASFIFNREGELEKFLPGERDFNRFLQEIERVRGNKHLP